VRQKIFSRIPSGYKIHFSGHYKVWTLVLGLMLLFVLGLSLSWKLRTESVIQDINDRHSQQTRLVFNIFSREASELGLRASEMRDSFLLTRFLTDRTDEHRTDVYRLFSNTIKTHPAYEYLHILDNAGIEVLRVARAPVENLERAPDDSKDYSQGESYRQAIELLGDQFLVTAMAPEVGNGRLVVGAVPSYEVITPLVVSGEKYGYLIYRLNSTVFFNKFRTFFLLGKPKSELDIYTNSGVWTTSGESTEWTWASLPATQEMIKEFGKGDIQPLPNRISDQWIQFVDFFGRATAVNPASAPLDVRLFRKGQTLLSSLAKITPVVVRVDYDAMLSSVNLSPSDRRMELVWALLAAVICTLVGNYVWLKVSGWITQMRRERRELQDAANLDFLTGVMTRKAFLTYATPHFSELPTLVRPSAILMLDLDCFKAINDNYGHFAGDAVLQEIAKAVERELRENDRIARWGGDEFVILLGSVEPSQVYSIAERIRIGVMGIKHDVSLVGKAQVTASIGIISARGGSLTDSIEYADKALYQAKKGGGNRVVVIPYDDGAIAQDANVGAVV